MAAKARDLTGLKFGNLTALAPTTARSGSKAIMWLCRCDCGKEKQISSVKLNAGETKSCGCQKYKRKPRLSKGESGLNSLWIKYKGAAKKRNYSFDLTKAEFKKLTSSNCFYCGVLPHRIQVGSKGNAKEHGLYKFNGIDRLDNSKGYTKDNCVTCCKVCNYAKGQQSLEEFKSWIEQVYENFIIS